MPPTDTARRCPETDVCVCVRVRAKRGEGTTGCVSHSLNSPRARREFSRFIVNGTYRARRRRRRRPVDGWAIRVRRQELP